MFVTYNLSIESHHLWYIIKLFLRRCWISLFIRVSIFLYLMFTVRQQLVTTVPMKYVNMYLIISYLYYDTASLCLFYLIIHSAFTLLFLTIIFFQVTFTAEWKHNTMLSKYWFPTLCNTWMNFKYKIRDILQNLVEFLMIAIPI